MTHPMDDALDRMWDVQAEQQRELGLDPSGMTEVERARTVSDLILQLHEEATELGRLTSTYKRHLMLRTQVHSDNVAEEIADILKVTLALAQLHGISRRKVFQTFLGKTAVVKARAAGDAVALEKDTRLVCVDLDDCVCDLLGWKSKNWDTRGADLGMMEMLKEEFYTGGKFRELEPIPNAPESIRQLKRMGYKIVILTARPHWQYKQLYADTLDWLNTHGVPHDLILFNKDKVEALYEHVMPAWPTAFVEDHPRNALALADVGVNVLLFDQEHNRKVETAENIHRVLDWAEVMDRIGEAENATHE